MKAISVTILLLINNLLPVFSQQKIAAKKGVEIISDFPGGNIILDSVVNDRIYLHPDINGTSTNWFYWNFKVRGGVPGKKYTFIFTHPWKGLQKYNIISVNGPALSTNDGFSWSWLGKESITGHNTFTYTFSTGKKLVNFSVAIPYTASDYNKFIKKYTGNINFWETSLAVSESARKVERLHVGKIHGQARYKVVITARHHACESMGSYVLEGIISNILDGTDSWLRDNVDFLILPFMDKDGVEEGRQGKNRIPHDHNRDYYGESIYASVGSLKKVVPAWIQDKKVVAIDIHCPFIRGKGDEKVFQVQSENQTMQIQQGLFASALEKSLSGSLPYEAGNDLKFGDAWNKSTSGSRFSDWASNLTGIQLCTTLEIPYSNASGTVVTADNTRALGKDIAAALSLYLKGVK